MGSVASTSHDAGPLAVAVNAFGSKLFEQLPADDKPGATTGRFLSPYGIAAALGMLLNGVEPGGESYRQLQAAVYGGGAALDTLNAQLRQLSQALVKGGQGPAEDGLTVADANSAWLAPRYTLQKAYADALAAVFGAAAQPLTGATAVNEWVAQATRGKISEIVDDGAVAQAVVVLVNAIYMKGLWLHPFKESSTHPADFALLQHGAAPLQAATMCQTFKGRSAVAVVDALPAATAGGAELQCAAVQMPYRGNEYYAVAAVPKGDWSDDAAAGGQRALATAAGAVPFNDALAACRQALLDHLPGAPGAAAGGHWRVPQGVDVKLFLPRFEVEYGANLNAALQALGIHRPFEGGDITQIATDGQGHPVGDLVVSDVIHKVYCKVDEAGTEAAAATAVVMLRSSMPMPREEIEIRFDRPFVFAVVHAPTGLALFCGEVHRPEEWKGRA